MNKKSKNGKVTSVKLAQWVELLSIKQIVVGSTPTFYIMYVTFKFSCFIVLKKTRRKRQSHYSILGGVIGRRI